MIVATILVLAGAGEPRADGELLGGAPLARSAPPWEAIEHPRPPTALWGSTDRALPTCAWWQNLVLEDGGQLACTLPYQVRARADGLHACLPGIVATPQAVMTGFVDDVVLGAEGELPARRVAAYDDLSVTVAWTEGSRGLTAPLVRGMPYVSGRYERTAPRVSSARRIEAIDGRGVEGGGGFSGQRFELRLAGGGRWVLYASRKIAFRLDGGALVATRPFTGWLRVAYAPEGADETLDAHAGRIPLGGAVSATADGDSARVTFRWCAEGRGDLLAYTLPHHRDVLERAQETELSVTTVRGPMRAVVGDQWAWDEPLTAIAWDPPRAVPQDRRGAIRAALREDADRRVRARDPYFGGKQMAALGRLALIADALDEPDLADGFRGRVRAALDRRLAVGERSPLVTDTTWGGVIARDGLRDPGRVFGQSYYNDHHFHYGYWIYAAAVLARGDAEWREANADAVTHLVRDIANPSAEDPHYARMRCLDWYVGHSWASGLFAFGDGRNQESTSEAVNAWYAMSLWGRATGDARVRDLGRLLLATEIRSARRYWQPTRASEVYPREFAERKVVGILWSAKVDHATFFGNELEKVHCIQMLPFTPISEELLRGEWIAESYPIVSRALTTASEGWRGFILMAGAILDPDRAWEAALELERFDDGNSRANMLHWIATRR